MTTEQMLLFGLLGFVFVLLIWGRFRYDLVAFAALIGGVVIGVVPQETAFTGFGHPAVIIIALVLIVSKGLSNSGAIELLARFMIDSSRKLSAHIGIMAGLAAALSAVMNNVGALALLMPVDLQAAEKAKRSPALTLMPLSFASILGGLVTLIGTPPNIIIASYREKALGAPYEMFDFAPVGLVLALVGVLFVALIGWRLLPRARMEQNQPQELFKLDDYVAEVRVTEESPLIGKRLRDVKELNENADVQVLGVVRRGNRLPGQPDWQIIEAGDILAVEANPKALEDLSGSIGVDYVGSEKLEGALVSEDTSFMEVVVPVGARIEGRSALNLRLLYRHNVTLMGISRQGQKIQERVRRTDIRAGDILLLYGPTERLPEIASWLGGLPLAERGLQVIKRDKALLAVGLFAVAILMASFGILYLPFALGLTAIFYVLFNIVSVKRIYDSVEWPVIVLLGSLIPVGAALEASGGTGLIANWILSVTQGAAPWVVLTLLMVVTMTLSDVLNNTATAVIAAPIAVELANRLDVSADPFLMAVAVAASCAFLTPIGHKNNTLIMGPGGYKFGDYWRMGLPLEILIVVVAVPAIMLFWSF
ncbi:MAG: SLC13 family permease [Rhodomicrobium sp.]|nr:MAG: SLC13 family permease [Rhodomicrobium sp.]